MATATRPITIGPADHGRKMTLDEFIDAEFEGGWLYELARGVVDVTEVPAPSHGWTVRRVARLFDRYDEAHSGLIKYLAGGGECRLRFPGMQSDRHPDQAIYLDPMPPGKRVWMRWVPHIVVEIVSVGGEDRDHLQKREEYLRAGVHEYWIVEPRARKLVVLSRVADVWEEQTVAPGEVYRTHFLPGLEVRPEEILGPDGEVEEDDDEDEPLEPTE